MHYLILAPNLIPFRGHKFLIGLGGFALRVVSSSILIREPYQSIHKVLMCLLRCLSILEWRDAIRLHVPIVCPQVFSLLHTICFLIVVVPQLIVISSTAILDLIFLYGSTCWHLFEPESYWKRTRPLLLQDVSCAWYYLFLLILISLVHV